MKENIVITGASSGLGACLARKFSENGDTVVILYTNEAHMQETAKTLPGPYHAYKINVADPENVSAVFEQIYKDLGTIDRLINCAGVGFYDVIENVPDKETNRMIDINLKGTIFCTKAVIPAMKKANKGYIINVVSMDGVRALPEEAAYTASKFGVRGFMKALSLELAGLDVKISNFYMGAMATPMFKDEPKEWLDKLMLPEDIADIIFEMTKIRKNLLVDEVRILNIKPQ